MIDNKIFHFVRLYIIAHFFYLYKNPDLFYNRGVVHAYLENYQNTYNDFKDANDIDETLKVIKFFLCNNILEIVQSTSKSIKNICRLKPKKLP